MKKVTVSNRNTYRNPPVSMDKLWWTNQARISSNRTMNVVIFFFSGWRLSLVGLEAIAIKRSEAIASRLEAIASRSEAIASRSEAIVSRSGGAGSRPAKRRAPGPDIPSARPCAKA